MEMNTQRVTVCDNNGMISVSSPTTLKFAQPKCQYSLLDIDWNSLKSLSDRLTKSHSVIRDIAFLCFGVAGSAGTALIPVFASLHTAVKDANVIITTNAMSPIDISPIIWLIGLFVLCITAAFILCLIDHNRKNKNSITVEILQEKFNEIENRFIESEFPTSTNTGAEGDEKLVSQSGNTEVGETVMH